MPEASLLTLRKLSSWPVLLGSPKTRPFFIQVTVGEELTRTALHQQEKLSFSFNVTPCGHVIFALGLPKMRKIR